MALSQARSISTVWTKFFREELLAYILVTHDCSGRLFWLLDLLDFKDLFSLSFQDTDSVRNKRKCGQRFRFFRMKFMDSC